MGETILEEDHLQILKEKYSIPVDSMMDSNPNTVYGTMFEAPISDMGLYIKEMRKLSLVFEHIVSMEGASWKAMTSTMPFLHILSFPRLALFHMYISCFYQLDNEQSYEEFVRSIPVKEVFEIHLILYNILLKLDSTEIVSESGLLWMKESIEVFYESGKIEKKETALALLKDYRYSIERMKEWCIKGDKNGSGKFELHIDDLKANGNSLLFFNHAKPTVVFISMLGGCFYMTDDYKLLKLMDMETSVAKRRYTYMCEEGELEVNEFFNNLFRVIQKAESKLH